MWPGDEFFGTADLHRPVAGHVFDAFAEQSKVAGNRRIDHMDEFHRYPRVPRHGMDGFSISEQDRSDHLLGHQARRRLDHTDVFTFGENHAFWMTAQLVEQVLRDGDLRGCFVEIIGHAGLGT